MLAIYVILHNRQILDAHNYIIECNDHLHNRIINFYSYCRTW